MSWLPRNKVLVPTDFSEPSVEAIRTARELAENDADLTVLHVLEPIEYTAPASLFGDFDPDARTSRATKFLDDFLQRHELTGLATAIVIGNPGMKITEFASESHVELIVLPSHGHHGLKRILLGSVAERVLRHAECPVLVLRRMDNDE
ncbi:MAG: universal stress protein [Planctomycetes bacterium]|nr:universal stress protein [Planctomycetota bacterium]